MQSLMTNISPNTPTGYSTRKELYRRNPVRGLFLNRQYRYRFTSAVDQIMVTIANSNGFVCLEMKYRLTTFLARIWAMAPTRLPLDFPSTISRMSLICSSCTACSAVTSTVISAVWKPVGSRKSCSPTWRRRKVQPTKLTAFTTESIQFINSKSNSFYFNLTMTRGNQREIDRERARKRNADKNVDNKRDQKSDFFKNKETHAEIMRNKQKKHEEQLEEKPEKKDKNYKEDYE